MEGCPRSSMLSIDLKDSSPTEFSAALKKYINEHYQEDPENYKHECQQLEGLRSTCLHPSHDHSGCSVLRRYFAQLQFLQSRFPMADGEAVAIPFTWIDLYSEESITLSDVRFEQASILHNLGALHSLLGSQEDRTGEEGMKVACTHFQAAAGVFQYLKSTVMVPLASLKLPWVSEDHFAVPFFDLASCVLQLYISIMLGQAQECLLEKSILDGRKDSLVARISMQVYDYYQQALGILESLGSSYMGSKKAKTWTKTIKIKACHFLCVSYVYLSNHANDNQRFGEKVAYLKAASQKLTEAQKLSKGQPERTLELLQFMADVVSNKLEGAVKDNDFIYHEVVPDLATLPETKGASLVKPIPFQPCDPSVSGPDIFQRLIPIEAHTDASIYSEEKAKLLRRYSSSVDVKNKQLVQSLASLHIDDLLQPEEVDVLPSLLKEKQEALRKDVALLAQADENIQESSKVGEEIENILKTISSMLDEEEKKETLIKEKFGPKPSPPERNEIKGELGKCKEALSKANQTNNELVRVYNAHRQNLELIAGPEEKLMAALPSLNIIDSPVDDGAVQRLRDLIAKVEEMKKQRKNLEENLKKQLNEDDITALLVTREDGNKMAFFDEQLKKHQGTCSLIQANLDAQERILSALTEANAKYAKTRQAVKENSQRREEVVQALLLSYNTFCELQGKLSRGVQFYRNLSKTVCKLEEKCKNFFDDRSKELDKLYEKVKNTSEPPKPPTRPSAAKPDHLVRPQPLLPSVPGPRLSGPMSRYHHQGGFPLQFPPGPHTQVVSQGDIRKITGHGFMDPTSSHFPSSSMEQFIPRQGQQLPGNIPNHPLDARKQDTEKGPFSGRMESSPGNIPTSLHDGNYRPHLPSSGHPVPQTHIPADQAIHSTPRMSYPFPVRQEGTQVPGKFAPSMPGQNVPRPRGPDMQHQRLPFNYQNQMPPRLQPPHSSPGLHHVQQLRPGSPGQGPSPQEPGISAQMPPRFQGQEKIRPQYLPGQQQFPPQMTLRGDPQQHFRPPHPSGSSQQIVFQRHPQPYGMLPTPSSPMTQPFNQPLKSQLVPRGPHPQRSPPQLPLPLQPQSIRAQHPIQPGQPSHPMQPQPPKQRQESQQEALQQPEQMFSNPQQQNPQQQQQQNYHGQQQPQSFQQPSQQQLSSRLPQPLSPSLVNQPQPYLVQNQNQHFQQQQQVSPQQPRLPFTPDQPFSEQCKSGQPSLQPFRPDQTLKGQFRPDQSLQMPPHSEQQPRLLFYPEQQSASKFYSGQQRQLSSTHRPQFQPQQQLQQPLRPFQSEQQPHHSLQTVHPYSSDQVKEQTRPPLKQVPFRPDFVPTAPSPLNPSGHEPKHPSQVDGTSRETIPSQQQPFPVEPTSTQHFAQQNHPLSSQAANKVMSSHSYPETGAFLSDQPCLSVFPPGIPQARRPTPSVLQANQGNRLGSVTSSDYLTSFSVALAHNQLSQYQSSTSQQQTQQIQQQLLLQQQQLILQQQEMLKQQQTLQSHEHEQSQIGLLLQQILQQQKQLAELEMKFREKDDSVHEHEHVKDSPKTTHVQEHEPKNISQLVVRDKSKASQENNIHDCSGMSVNTLADKPINLKKDEDDKAAVEVRSKALTESLNEPTVPDYSSISQWFTDIKSNKDNVHKSSYNDSVDKRNKSFEDNSESDKNDEDSKTHTNDVNDESKCSNIDKPKPSKNENLDIEYLKENEKNIEEQSGTESGKDGEHPEEVRRREIEEQIKHIKELQQKPQNQHPPCGYLYEPGKLPVVLSSDQHEHSPNNESESGFSSDSLIQNEKVPTDENMSCKMHSDGPNEKDEIRLYSDGPSEDEYRPSDERRSSDKYNVGPSHSERRPSDETRPSVLLSDGPIQSERRFNESESLVPNQNILVPTDKNRKPSFHRQCGHYYETQLSRLGHDANNTCLSNDESLQALMSTVQGFDNVVKSLAAVKRGTNVDGFTMEWTELERLQELDSASMTTHAAMMNQSKNRYRDVLPWDHTRVKLQSKEESDYINANLFKEITPLTPSFIATQGPIATTLTDFWMMVWEQQSPLIVMLTREVEGNRLMCHQYWPIDEGHTVLFGPIRVSLKTLSTNPSWVKRIMHVQCNDSQDTLEVTHLQFTGWPDYGVPGSPSDLLTFIIEVRSCYKQLEVEDKEKPIVMHCSAGIGRTGSFVVIYAAIEEFDAHRIFVNIPRLVRSLRLQRKHMVQKKEQYEFCYNTVLFYALQYLDLELNSIAMKNKASQQQDAQVEASAPYIEDEDGENTKNDSVFDEDPMDSRQKSSSVRFIGELKSDDSLEEDLNEKSRKQGESVNNEQSISEKYCQGTLETDSETTKKRCDKFPERMERKDRLQPAETTETKQQTEGIHTGESIKQVTGIESEGIQPEPGNDENGDKHYESVQSTFGDHVAEIQGVYSKNEIVEEENLLNDDGGKSSNMGGVDDAIPNKISEETNEESNENEEKKNTSIVDETKPNQTES